MNIFGKKLLAVFSLTVLMGATVACNEPEAPAPTKRTLLRQDKNFKVNAVDLGKYARFTLQKESADVELVFGQAVQSVEVRPSVLGIQYQINGNKVTLLDMKPCKAAVVVNGDYENPVYLFIDKRAPKEWSDLPANTIRYAKGTHNVGEVVLDNDATVFLEEGASIVGNFYAKDKKNVRILGYGVIDGRNRQKGIRFERCENVEVNGPVVMSRRGWTTSYFECRNVRIDNVKLLGSDIYSDGIDLVGTSDVAVNDIFVRNEDDCIAIKTNKYGFSGNVENITVTNSVFWVGKSGNGLEIGWELDGDYVRDIRFENIDFIRKEGNPKPWYRGMISIHQCGNSTISNVLYKNIRMEDALEDLVWIELRPAFFSGDSGTVWGSGDGSIDNIRLENVVYTKGTETSAPKIRIMNTSGSTIGKLSNISISGLEYDGRKVTDLSDPLFIIHEPEQVKIE